MSSRYSGTYYSDSSSEDYDYCFDDYRPRRYVGRGRHASIGRSDTLFDPPMLCNTLMLSAPPCHNPHHMMPRGALPNDQPLGPVHRIAVEEGICLHHVDGGCHDDGICEQLQQLGLREIGFRQGFTSEMGEIDGRQGLRMAVGLPPGRAGRLPPPGVRNALTGEVGPEIRDGYGGGGQSRGGLGHGGAASSGGQHRLEMMNGGGAGDHSRRRRAAGAYQVEEQDEMDDSAAMGGRRRHHPQGGRGAGNRSRRGPQPFEDHMDEAGPAMRGRRFETDFGDEEGVGHQISPYAHEGEDSDTTAGGHGSASEFGLPLRRRRHTGVGGPSSGMMGGRGAGESHGAGGRMRGRGGMMGGRGGSSVSSASWSEIGGMGGPRSGSGGSRAGYGGGGRLSSMDGYEDHY